MQGSCNVPGGGDGSVSRSEASEEQARPRGAGKSGNTTLTGVLGSMDEASVKGVLSISVSLASARAVKTRCVKVEIGAFAGGRV